MSRDSIHLVDCLRVLFDSVLSHPLRDRRTYIDSVLVLCSANCVEQCCNDIALRIEDIANKDVVGMTPAKHAAFLAHLSLIS